MAAAAGVTAVDEVSTVAGETVNDIANAAVGASVVSCVSTALGAAGTSVESVLFLEFLEPYDGSVNVHDFIINLLSACSIFTVVLQGLDNDSM